MIYPIQIDFDLGLLCSMMVLFMKASLSIIKQDLDVRKGG